MFSQSRVRFLGLVAAAGILVTLATAPASADEQVSRLGPVGPHEPVLSSVGEKRIVAFYAKDAGHCAVQMVAWDNSDADSPMAKFGPDPARLALRVRISLEPLRIAHIETVDETIDLQCGENAETLVIVDTRELVASGTSAPKVIPKVTKASTSGF
jgi:hypothetical protein